jgi:hypothetical protein
MSDDTDGLIELVDDEHQDAQTAAEDTARLLMAVRDHRRTRANTEPETATGSPTDPPADVGSKPHE